MRYLSAILSLTLLVNLLQAQALDSLSRQSLYQQAWETAMADGKISPDEQALMQSLGSSLGLPADSSHNWEVPRQHLVTSPLVQSGRWPLIMQNMAFGAGLYGWGVPYVLRAEDSRWYVGGEMVSLGTAYYLTYKYTRTMNVSHARAQMMRSGSLLGLRYGTGINQLLELDAGDSDQHETLWTWVLMASVPAGQYGGDQLFSRYQPTNGQAWVWTTWTGIAGITARLIHSVLVPTPTYPEYGSDTPGAAQAALDAQYTKDKQAWDRQKTLVELAAYPLGIAAGYRLIHDKPYSFGDALMLLQGWGFGFYNSMMLQSIISEDEDPDLILMISSLGAIGSTLAYDRWVRDDDYTFGQATLMLLGSASGSAFGFGTGILLNVTDRKPLLTLALLGYGAGTWMTHNILDLHHNGSFSAADTPSMILTPTLLAARRAPNSLSNIPGLQFTLHFK